LKKTLKTFRCDKDKKKKRPVSLIHFTYSKKILSFAKHFYQITVKEIMKKAVSISLSILMLTAILHFSVATHFCGGKIAASVISFTGKQASCGMKADERDNLPAGISLRTHCCDNVLVVYGITANYFPSFSYVPESYQDHFQALSLPASYVVQSLTVFKSIYTSVSPPDAFLSTNVDLSNICVFRI